MHGAADGNPAYRVGVQRSVVNASGRTEPVPMKPRVTEIYRREDGNRKLVHRHADRLAE
jgi:hypothetical protein